MFWIRNAKANADWHIGDGLNDGDLFRNAGGDAGLGAGDAETRYVIDKALSAGRDLLDSLRGGGGGDELNVAEVRRGFEFGVLSGFVRWEVKDQNAIGSSRGSFVVEPLITESVNGVEVGEEDERNLGKLAKLTNHIENALGGGASAESAVGSELVDDAVGEWI